MEGPRKVLEQSTKTPTKKGRNNYIERAISNLLSRRLNGGYFAEER